MVEVCKTAACSGPGPASAPTRPTSWPLPATSTAWSWSTRHSRAALNALATVAPGWLCEQAPPEWLGRYAARVEETRLPNGQEARYAHAEVIGADGHRLLEASGATR